MRLAWRAAILASVLGLLSAKFGICGQLGSSARGIVASGNTLATQIGVSILKQGGNAVDAAVAVGLALGVVDPDNSGIGGGCFILIRLADGRCVGIDGREMAPAAATRDMFARNGRADTELSQTGALASGVPGALAAYEHAARKFGRMNLRQLIAPAADLAARGFPLDANTAATLREVAADMALFDSSRVVFFKNGQPLKEGETLVQPDLATTYRAIAREGSRWFYRGPFAHATEQWMRARGGILTAADFRDYRIRIRKPILTDYRGFRLVTFPPPSSGGVHVAQILNILEQFDLKSLDDATRLHVIAEAMKLAFADRAHWLGDPEFAKVPRGLVDKEYAATLARQIDLRNATRVPTHGEPRDWQRDVFKKHTTHFSVADAEGNWVACTATVNTSFGSKVVVPGTGVVLNNEMDDFSIQPGVTNAFGLIGAAANSVQPRKRPLSSMSPTIVLKDGRPIIALGAAGGPKIISQVVLELVAMLDLGQTPEQAIAAPRLHHQWSPDILVVDRSLPTALRDALAGRGHKLMESEGMGISHIVARSPDGSAFVGAADPRGNGSVGGW